MVLGYIEYENLVHFRSFYFLFQTKYIHFYKNLVTSYCLQAIVHRITFFIQWFDSINFYIIWSNIPEVINMQTD